MAAAPALPTTGAAGHADLEAAYDRAHLDIALDLLVGRFDHRGGVAAVRAALRRRHVDHPVSRRRLGHRAKSRRGAVAAAAFSSGLFRVGLGKPARERGGLAFAAAAEFFDDRLQLGDACLQPGDLRVTGVNRIGSFGRVVHDEARYNTKKQKARIFGAIQLPTGFYVHTKPKLARAVCLTEAPIDECGELAQTHGAYGYVFAKKHILGVGGAPAMYLTEAQIRAQERRSGFAPGLIPLVNLIRIPSAHPGKRKVDYLHEREWRVPGDIDLKEVIPFGVIIPGRSGYEKFRGPDWETLLRAAAHYEEMNDGDDAAA
jgi:hypothetical protein